VQDTWDEDLRELLNAKHALKKAGKSDIITPDELFDACLKWGVEVRREVWFMKTKPCVGHVEVLFCFSPLYVALGAFHQDAAVEDAVDRKVGVFCFILQCVHGAMSARCNECTVQ